MLLVLVVFSPAAVLIATFSELEVQTWPLPSIFLLNGDGIIVSHESPAYTEHWLFHDSCGI